MEPLLKNLVKEGVVSSCNPDTCSARVAFTDQSGKVSYDLPVLVRGSLHTKDYWMPEPGEQVVCLFLPSGNARGYIIGAVYSKKDRPPVTNAYKRHMAFSDGTTLEYDQSTHILTVNAAGTINIVAAKGISLSATDGVSITGKNDSESW